VVEAEWLDEGTGRGGGAGRCETVDFETGRDVLKGALETLDVSIELSDVVLEPFDPALLLAHALTTLPLAVTNEFRKVVGQPFILLVVDVGEGGVDGGEYGGGEGSHMYRCPCRLMRYGGGVLRKPGAPWTRWVSPEMVRRAAACCSSLR